ncbi:MAG: divalent-cation tolerance protein CutA [Natronomonas sp.]
MQTVYTTVPPEAAADIAAKLVDEGHAACVNRLDCHSTYRWDGKQHEDPETLLLIKTTDDAATELESRLLELHPYDVPCIERFEPTAVHDPFAAWIERSVETE